MGAGFDWTGLAYWVVVPFALYAIGWDKLPQATRDAVKSPGVFGAMLGLGMAIFPKTVEAYQPIFFVIVFALWVWIVRTNVTEASKLKIQEEKQESKIAVYRISDILSEANRLLSRLVRFYDNLNADEFNLLSQIVEYKDDSQSYDNLVAEKRREYRARYDREIYDELLALDHRVQSLGVCGEQFRIMLQIEPADLDDYEQVLNTLAQVVATLKEQRAAAQTPEPMKAVKS